MNSFLWLFVSMSALTPLPRQGEGELLFVYEPKHCLMPPCPQFRALEKDRQSIADAGFDIVDFKHSVSLKNQLKTGDSFRAKGRWTRDEKFSNYFEFRLSAGQSIEVIKVISKPLKGKP